jgi:hypothetical protein
MQTVLAVVLVLACGVVLPDTAGASDGEPDAAYRQALADIPGLPRAVFDGARKEGKLTLYHLANKVAVQEIIREFSRRFWMHTAPWEADLLAREGLLMNVVPTSDGAYPDHLKNRGWWYPLVHQLIGPAWNTGCRRPSTSTGGTTSRKSFRDSSRSSTGTSSNFSGPLSARRKNRRDYRARRGGVAARTKSIPMTHATANTRNATTYE